jgi:hypothetical protein
LDARGVSEDLFVGEAGLFDGLSDLRRNALQRNEQGKERRNSVRIFLSGAAAKKNFRNLPQASRLAARKKFKLKIKMKPTSNFPVVGLYLIAT